MKTARYLLYVICIVSFVNTSNSQSLQAGDLLFQDLNCGELCNAIEAVTQGVDGKDFSHCGIVVKTNTTLQVVEAIGSEVQLTSIHDFFARSSDTTVIKNITVGRLKPRYQHLVEKAQVFAIAQIGKPYDDVFNINNEAWYCSELVYQAYKEANDGKEFFPLAPMTYKNPQDHNFFPAWVTYFHKLNVPIPEGDLGTNPGLISRSNKIKIVEIDLKNI